MSGRTSLQICAQACYSQLLITLTHLLEEVKQSCTKSICAGSRERETEKQQRWFANPYSEDEKEKRL